MAGNNRLLIFKEGSGISKWGLTEDEYKKKEGEYYSSKDPRLVLEVFKFEKQRDNCPYPFYFLLELYRSKF